MKWAGSMVNLKRSKMIEILDKAIEEYDLPSQEPFCGFLLQRLEDGGMLPPARIGALVGIDGIPVHSWEPEEEPILELPTGKMNENLVTKDQRKGFFDNSKLHIFRGGQEWD